jgi:putative SOS response-associated peptidase YedK
MRSCSTPTTPFGSQVMTVQLLIRSPAGETHSPAITIKSPSAIAIANGCQSFLRWGLVPRWAQDIKAGYSTFNARADSIADKPAFRVEARADRGLGPRDRRFPRRPAQGITGDLGLP